MEEPIEEEYSKDMTRAKRRKEDWHHAIHKKKISSRYAGNYGWYKHLHEYSKNKIHCSCPICSGKTRAAGKKDDWTMQDKRRIEEMKEQENETEEYSSERENKD